MKAGIGEKKLHSVRNAWTKYMLPFKAGRIGCVAFFAAAFLVWMDLRLAVIPLGVFVILCIAAAFIPSSSFFLPVISRGVCCRKAVALTFDDGPDPLTTPVLLRLLKKYQAAGTFFVTGQRVVRYPELVQEILAEGHSLANHSFHHDALSAFRSSRTMRREIEATQQALRDFGIVALAYRPPMGITTPQLHKALKAEGMYVVNFRRRAWDGGNRWIRNLSKRILKHLRPNDILLLHDRLPYPSLLSSWTAEMDQVLRGIQEKSLEVIPLPDLIGRPVMIPARGDPNVLRDPNRGSPSLAAADMKPIRPIR